MPIRTTRRGFLGATGIAGLAAVAPRPASALIEPAPWGIKLGIATYTFRNFDRAQTIAYLKQIQAPWISVKDVDKQLSHHTTPEQLEAAHHEFADGGFKVMSVGNVDMTKAKTIGELRVIFDWAKAFGAPMMVCAPTHDNIKLVETLVKQYNIKIAIHDHGPEDHNFPTPQSVLEAVRNLDPRCGLCLDVGHTARTGTDVVKAIADAGPRLLDMHVKDLAFFEDRGDKLAKASQCDVGDGIMPFPQIFKQLKKMNYQGCVNLEYEINGDNPLPGVQRSMSYMRGVLAGPGGRLSGTMADIPAGTRGEKRILVTGENAIDFLGLEGARVLSTPHMIGYMERTCRDTVLPLLDSGHDTVGTQVNVSHLAAAPLGMAVRFLAEVTAVDGRRIQFRVEAWDEKEKIGEGTHERTIVNVAKFAARLAEKKKK